jgi:hypothetical protein
MSIFAVRRAVVAICALVLAFGVFTRCNAQTTYGSIVGTARDTSGAVIVGAKVTVTNVGTAVKTTQETNGVGAYSFNTLFPGAYTIHAEMQNFKSVDIQNIQLQVDQTLRYDLAMELGQVSQSVVVNETLATLNTDTADVGEVIENRQVTDLPLNGRNFVQLAGLANDVFFVGANNNGDSAGQQVTSEGSRLFSNSYLFDGVEIRVERGGSYGVSPSIDAIGEFKMLQNTFSAEYGYGQTVLNSTIKNGTNQFHGVGFDFIRNDALDAFNAFNHSGQKNGLKQQQCGGSFGGPIKKEKLFFFVNYEATRTTKGNVSNLLNPTADQLAGDLSTMSQIAIDPTTGLQFQDGGVLNKIPDARIGNFAKQAAAYFVAPSGTPGPGYNLSAVTNETVGNDQGLARIDYYLSQKDHIDGFVSINHFTDIDPAVNPYQGMSIWRKGYPIVGAEWSHQFTPTILNNAHFGYAHQVIYEGQQQIASSNLSGTVFGVQNINPDSFALAIPLIGISGFANTGPQAWQPTGDTNINTQFSDMVMITRGHHILKLGGDYRDIFYGDLGWATQDGEFDFNGFYTTGYDPTGTTATAGTGNPIADLLLSVPNYAHAALKGSGDYPYNLQWASVSGYGQDDWRITPELTLNLGVRWEMIQNAREINNQFVNFDTATQTFLFAGKTMPDRIYPAQKTNFLPRIGAAYSPKWLPKTVIRGGFSIATGGARAWEYAQQHFQPPYVNENFDSIYGDTKTQNLPNYVLPGSGITVPAGSTDAAPTVLFPAPVIDFTGANLVPVALNDSVEKKVPKYAEWNFNIQHELPGALVLQVGYVGTKGYSLPIRYDTNLATTVYDPNASATQNDIQNRVPYPQLGYICGNTFEGYSSFNALNVHLERRFANGMSLTAAYSWAKDLEVATQDEAELFDIKNLRLNYGPNNMAQHAVFNYIYELPFGHGKLLASDANGVLNQIIGGWQFDGITTWNSGSYLTASSDVNNGMGGRAGNYPDAVAGQNPNSGKHTTGQWFNTAAFANPPYTRYGNSHAGTVIGPGLVNFDLAFFKNIKFTESKYFQFRWEMFNAFNHVQLYNPNMDFGGGSTASGSFGTISGSNDARIMQIGMKFYF